MKIRVILLVLAVSSLILFSFMLPLALLLRSFAADNAVSTAQIRARTWRRWSPPPTRRR